MDLLHAPEKPGDGRSRNLSHHRRLTCTAGPVALEGRPGPGADADLRGHLGQRLPHTCEVGRTAQEARAAGLGLFPLGKQTKREGRRGDCLNVLLSQSSNSPPCLQPRTEKPLVPPLTQAAASFRCYGRSRCARGEARVTLDSRCVSILNGHWLDGDHVPGRGVFPRCSEAGGGDD